MATYGGNHAQYLALGSSHRRHRPADHRSGTQNLSKISDAQLRHRKRIQAGLTATTATIGLAALGSKGAAVGARKFIKPAAKGERVAQGFEHHAGNALLVGAGLGGVSGYNAASISRAESKRPNYSAHIRKDWKKYDEDRRLLRQHGLRGAPQGVDRETRQKIWEARAKHLNRRRNRWERTSHGAAAAETVGGVAAGGVGATLAAHQIREAYRNEPGGAQKIERGAAKLHRALVPHLGSARTARVVSALAHGRPNYKVLAVGAAGGVTAAGAKELRTFANKKTRKYSTASGGIASGTARRMKDYDVTKSVSAFGVDHG